MRLLAIAASVLFLAGISHRDSWRCAASTLETSSGRTLKAPMSILAQANPVLLGPADSFWQQRSPDEFQVRIETSKGAFTVQVYRSWAPHGADRFYNLARAGFFDDSRFFRVRAGFIAQFGIPGEPKVTAAWKDRTFPDDPVKQSNTRGTMAFAMTGPDTRTTQLYINLADNSRLDAQGFAPLGRVAEGMEIVDRLYAGYGEQSGGGMRGGKQQKVLDGGNTYLDREFPNLDKLIKGYLVRPSKKSVADAFQTPSGHTCDRFVHGSTRFEGTVLAIRDRLKTPGFRSSPWTLPQT